MNDVEEQKEEQYEKGFDDGKEDGYNKAKSEFMAKLDDPRYIDYHAGKCLINHYVTGDDIEHCVDIYGSANELRNIDCETLKNYCKNKKGVLNEIHGSE